MKKIDRKEFEEMRSEKLDSEAFLEIFPSHRSPSETLQLMIRAESQKFNTEIRNLI